MIVTVWLSVGHYTETHCLPQDSRQISPFTLLMFVWPLSQNLFFSLYLDLFSYQLEMLCNVYSTPEALHNRKLTRKLVNVMYILFKDTFIVTIYTCSDAHLQLNKSFLNQSVIGWCLTLKLVGFLVASVIVQCTFAVFQCLMSGRHSETISSLQIQSQTVQYMIVKILAWLALTILRMLWPWYLFKIQTRPDLSSHSTKRYIFQRLQ